MTALENRFGRYEVLGVLLLETLLELNRKLLVTLLAAWPQVDVVEFRLFSQLRVAE